LKNDFHIFPNITQHSDTDTPCDENAASSWIRLGTNPGLRSFQRSLISLWFDICRIDRVRIHLEWTLVRFEFNLHES